MWHFFHVVFTWKSSLRDSIVRLDFQPKIIIIINHPKRRNKKSSGKKKKKEKKKKWRPRPQARPGRYDPGARRPGSRYPSWTATQLGSRAAWVALRPRSHCDPAWVTRDLGRVRPRSHCNPACVACDPYFCVFFFFLSFFSDEHIFFSGFFFFFFFFLLWWTHFLL